MDVRNHEGAWLDLPALYNGPAGQRDGVWTFWFVSDPRDRAQQALKPREISGTLDGVPARFRVQPIAGYHRERNPFLQASLIGDA